jgi:hypothetical protein
VAARWLLRYLEEDDDATIDMLVLAASCLAALTGNGYQEAAQALRDRTEKATRRRRGVALRRGPGGWEAPRRSNPLPRPFPSVRQHPAIASRFGYLKVGQPMGTQLANRVVLSVSVALLLGVALGAIPTFLIFHGSKSSSTERGTVLVAKRLILKGTSGSSVARRTSSS